MRVPAINNPSLLSSPLVRLKGSGAAKLALSTLISQGIVVIASPLITRLYAPSAVGQWQAFIYLYSFWYVGSCLRYEQAIIVAQDQAEAEGVFYLCLVCSTLSALFCFVIMSVAGASAFGLVEAATWAMPFSTVFGGCAGALTLLATRNRDFSLCARSRVALSTSQVLIQIGGALLLGGRSVALIVADCGSRFASGVMLFRCVKNRPPPPSELWKVARKFSRFPKFSLVASLVNAAALAAPMLLFAKFYGAEIAGYVAFCDRIVSMPVAVFGHAIAQTFTERAARLQRARPSQLSILLRGYAKRLAWAAAIPAVLVLGCAPVAVEYLFGVEWQQAGKYMQLLLPSTIVSFVVWPLMGTLNIIGRQEIQLVWDVCRVVVVITTLTVSSAIGATPTQAVFNYSVIAALGYLSHLLLCTHLARYSNSGQGATRRR